jgi:ABC-type transport system involved in cytochrome bd biosynthesis fused ATPase/permease subunit
MRLKSRRRTYLMMMSVCIVLFLLSWTVIVRLSVAAAAVTSVVALAIPPFAVIVANRGDQDGD